MSRVPPWLRWLRSNYHSHNPWVQSRGLACSCPCPFFWARAVVHLHGVAVNWGPTDSARFTPRNFFKSGSISTTFWPSAGFAGRLNWGGGVGLTVLLFLGWVVTHHSPLNREPQPNRPWSTLCFHFRLARSKRPRWVKHYKAFPLS